MYLFSWSEGAGLRQLDTLVALPNSLEKYYRLVVDRTTSLMAATIGVNTIRMVAIICLDPRRGLDMRQEIFSPSHISLDDFGFDLAFADGLLAVNARDQEVDNFVDAGVVYLYRISPDGRSSELLQRIFSPTNYELGYFGYRSPSFYRGRLMVPQRTGTNGMVFTYDIARDNGNTFACMSSALEIYDEQGISFGSTVLGKDFAAAHLRQQARADSNQQYKTFILSCNATSYVPIPATPPPPPGPATPPPPPGPATAPLCTCAADARAGVTWPTAPCGSTATLPCPHGNDGSAQAGMKRACLPSGRYASTVDTTTCASERIRALAARGVDSSTLDAAMAELSQASQDEADSFGTQDVVSVLRLVEAAADVVAGQGGISIATTEDIVASCDALLGMTEPGSFAAGEEAASNASSSATLGRALERISAGLAGRVAANTSTTVVARDSVALAVVTVGAAEAAAGTIAFPDRPYGAGTSVCTRTGVDSGAAAQNCTATATATGTDGRSPLSSPVSAPSANVSLGPAGASSVAFVFYSSGRAFQQEVEEGVASAGPEPEYSSDSVGGGSARPRHLPVGSVLSVQTIGAASSPRNASITFSLHSGTPTAADLPGARPSLCSFWQFAAGGAGGRWSQDGCRQLVSASTANRTVCQCDHLTNFAVLAGASSSGPSSSRAARLASEALDVLTYAGLAISVPCLLLVVAAYVLVPSARTQNKIVLMNIAGCLAVALVCLAGALLTTSRGAGCTAVAMLLHFALLAAFGWMLVQGLLTYQHFVEVFGRPRLAFRPGRLSLFVYSASLVVVAVTYGVLGADSYGTAEACWLDTEHGAIWAFLGPMLLVTAVNAGIVVRASVELRRERRNQEKMGQRKRQAASEAAKRILVNNLTLFSVLGVTWLLAVAVIASHGHVVPAYAFTICNVFQGVGILYFNVYRDQLLWKKVRVRRKQQRARYRVQQEAPSTSAQGAAGKSGQHSSGKLGSDSFGAVGRTTMTKVRRSDSSTKTLVRGGDAVDTATELSTYGFSENGMSGGSGGGSGGGGGDGDDAGLSTYGFSVNNDDGGGGGGGDEGAVMFGFSEAACQEAEEAEELGVSGDFSYSGIEA